jgi:N-methylhydantoinase B
VDIPPVGQLKQPMHVEVAVEVKDDEIVIDYEGSSPEVEAACNVTLPFTTSYTTYGIKVIVDPDVPNNAGCLAPITVKAPYGSLLNCAPPAPTWGRTVIAHNLPEIVFGALAPAIPERVIAACGSTPLVAMYFNGRKSNGQEFLSIVSHSGGFGGSGKRDGYGALCFPFNTAAIPVEVTENDTCLVYRKKEFAVDTAGPGRFRGGMGQEVIFGVATGDHAPPAPVASTIRGSSRSPDSTYPVFGREGGKPGRGVLITLKGEKVQPGLRHRLEPGDEIRLVLPGGGGFGSPLERDPAAVRADVIAGLVSMESARDEYGVVLRGEDFQVDIEATQALRDRLAR